MPAWRTCDPSRNLSSFQALQCSKIVLATAGLHETRMQFDCIFGFPQQFHASIGLIVHIWKQWGSLTTPYPRTGLPPITLHRGRYCAGWAFAMATTWTDDSIEVGATAPVAV